MDLSSSTSYWTECNGDSLNDNQTQEEANTILSKLVSYYKEIGMTDAVNLARIKAHANKINSGSSTNEDISDKNTINTNALLKDSHLILKSKRLSQYIDKLREENIIKENIDAETCTTTNTAENKMHMTVSKVSQKMQSGSGVAVNKPSRAEKMTYCRPVINMYNQEFIHKTMERNARLQQLVKRLVLVREREKQDIAWNNYINELKNKHKYPPELKNISINNIDDNSTDIFDYYNTKYSWDKSDFCQNLLQDFYKMTDDLDDYYKFCYDQRKKCIPFVYRNNTHCYPTSSHGRMIILNRQKNKKPNAYESQNPGRFFNENKLILENDEPQLQNENENTNNDYDNKTDRYNKFRKFISFKHLSIQTDPQELEERTNDEKDSFQEKYEQVSSNVEKLKQKVIQSQKEVKQCSLANIESKLDTLINSINEFMLEIRARKLSFDVKTINNTGYTPPRLIGTRSETVRSLKRQILCNVAQEKTHSDVLVDVDKGKGSINTILHEEINKSNEAKKEIERILGSDHPCAVKITFDIPTKERSTEVTDSLNAPGTTKPFPVQQIASIHNRRMTIAVNTDPLGLLALIRISTDTVKQILSYMPQIDYYAYLSKLQPPQMAKESQFVCNICGAAFDRPSQLSDHIQQHNLGNSRDCCVCRHALDAPRKRAALFSCRHCGQRFTRAYCRELHQRDCAKRLGIPTDTRSSLILLK